MSALVTMTTWQRPTVPIFVDTSALYALLVSTDQNHPSASSTFRGLRGSSLITHNYVTLECVALTQVRHGLKAVKILLNDLLAVVETQWVEPKLHSEAVAGLLASDRRDVSLVDRVSFAFMRDRGITDAFAFDRHFAEEGFNSVS